MNKNKIYHLLGLCFFTQVLMAQSLTKQAMYADFDTLIATIAKVSPHIPIKKDLWHYDAIKEMKRKRKSIDTISSDLSFYVLLNKVLNLAQDMHTSQLDHKGWAAMQDEIYFQIRNNFKVSIGHAYLNGKYIVTDAFLLQNDTIDIGYEITHFNGESVDEYVKKHLDSRYGATYDLVLHKFYSLGFYKNMETIFHDSIRLTFKSPQGKSKEYSLPTHQLTNFLPKKSSNKNDTTRVELWEKEKILYIKLSKMDPLYLPYLQNKIWKQRENTSGIEKIILDFRGNGGGEDTTWQTLYGEILPEKITYSLKIDAFQNGLIQKDIIEAPGLSAKLESDKTPFLKKYNFQTITNSVQTIEPLNTSIKFKGKIFVLVENHYSSTGSALVVPNANHSDKFYSVGRKTGYFLGVGFSPLKFILPHSGFHYRIAPSIEVTDAQKLTDLMQDKIEIEVPISTEELKIRANYNGSLNSKDYLLSHDPFIKAVIRL